MQLKGSANLPETNARLRQLDKRDWWRLAVALCIILALTTGIAGLSLPMMLQSLEKHEMHELGIHINGLWGMVLLFAVFAIYQQVMIMRLRRQLSAQIGMSTTLELLRPKERTEEGWKLQRKFPRYFVDERVSVRGKSKTMVVTATGRSTDISEGGMGAVLPEAFEAGAEVMIELEFAKRGERLAMPAVVRHRRGYYHGFELLNLTTTARESLRRSCTGLPLMEGRSPAAEPAEVSAWANRVGQVPDAPAQQQRGA